MQEERRPTTGRDVGVLDTVALKKKGKFSNATCFKVEPLPNRSVHSQLAFFTCQSGKWGENVFFYVAVLESTTQWAELLLQAQITLQTITHNERYSPTDTQLRGQLRFSLRDGDEMQSGTLMTQEGFKQREMSQQQQHQWWWWQKVTEPKEILSLKLLEANKNKEIKRSK